MAAACVLVTGCGGSSARRRSPAFDAGKSDTAKSARTLRLQSQLLTFKLVPAPGQSARPGGGLPAAAPSSSATIGAQLIFTGMLFHLGSPRATGRSQGACIRTAPGGGTVFQCTLTFVLSDGTIYGQGVASSGGPTSGVVSGGTGHYTGARGTFSYRGVANPRVSLTFSLQS